LGNEPDARMMLPIACTLDGAEAAARVSAWKQLTDAALLGRERTGAGIRLTFRAGAGVAEQLERLIELEGQCCAWMSFDVTDGDGLVVDVSAPDDTGRRALAEMFSVP
jgi:hypothetical protein